MVLLGGAIVAVIAVNGTFSFWQEYRAERAVAVLQRLLPRQVFALREGDEQQLSAAALVPGDVILIEEGAVVPADCRVIEAYGLRANLATVTGEALSATRVAEATEEDAPLQARNVLLAGTTIVSGEGRAVVYATGMRTEFGRIAQLAQSVEEIRTPLQREIARLSRLVAALASVLGPACFAAGQMLGLQFSESLVFAIGIIVANVPEGLLPTVTLALAMATQRMARRNILVRHLPAVEALGAASVIVTDKTGTLTGNSMRAASVIFDSGRFTFDALDPHLARVQVRFFEIARHCHGLRLVGEHGGAGQLGDPMETALLRMAQRTGAVDAVLERLDKLPFDAERRRMATLHRGPQGLLFLCKGAPESVVPLCTGLQSGAAAPAPLTPASRAQFLATAREIALRGERVLALAWRLMPEGLAREHWEEELVLAGLVGLEDPPRAEVAAAVRTCREAGIRVFMTTDDHPSTALAVARTTGLVTGESPRVVTGEALEHLSDTQLQFALDGPEVMFARVSAAQKLRVVEALRRKGHVVAATGDGVNDAPALRCADIGVAMGRTGADVARESADIVLLDDNFASIVAAIEEGRAVYDNLRKFLTYILISNIPEIVPYLAYVLARVPLPLTVIQILAVDLGTDMLPALALGAETPVPGTMLRPPRPRDGRLLSWPVLARAYLWLGPLEALAAMAAYFFVLQQGGWRYGDALAASDPLYFGNHGVSRRNRGDAGRERVPLPGPLSQRVRAPSWRQPAAACRNCSRVCDHRGDRLRAAGAGAVRYRAAGGAYLAVRVAVRGRDACARRETQARGAPPGRPGLTQIKLTPGRMRPNKTGTKENRGMPLTREEHEAMRRALEQRRDALAAELQVDAARAREETFGALAGPVTDTADEAVADLLSDIDNAELSRDLGELRSLDAALARLAGGDYGLCADCGAEIPFERLLVQPAALRCVDCQRVHEKTFAQLGTPKL